MYWSPNFLAVVFKKQEISQQVVTRMQDLASEFSKNFRGWHPRTLKAGGGDPLPHSTPSVAFDRARGAAPAPVLGPKPWSPNFSAVVATYLYSLKLCSSTLENITCNNNTVNTYYSTKKRNIMLWNIFRMRKNTVRKKSITGIRTPSWNTNFYIQIHDV